MLTVALFQCSACSKLCSSRMTSAQLWMERRELASPPPSAPPREEMRGAHVPPDSESVVFVSRIHKINYFLIHNIYLIQKCLVLVDNCQDNPKTNAKNGKLQNAGSPKDVSADAAACPEKRQARQSGGFTVEYTLQKFSSDVSLHINLYECKLPFQ